MIDLDTIAQLERDVRQGSRDFGTFGAAVDETFRVMRDLLAQVANVRFSAMAYLRRATEAEAACLELDLVQGKCAAMKEEIEALRSQAELFRLSWLSKRDECEALRTRGGKT